MKNVVPIFARAKNMAMMLDISLTLFHELVRDELLPDGYQPREQATSTKLWNIQEVCEKMSTYRSDNSTSTKEDPFNKAVRDGTR